MLTVYKPVTGRLRVKMPYRDDSRVMLTVKVGCLPEWNKAKKVWEVARSHLHDLVFTLLNEYGEEVQVIIDGRESEKCDTRCQAAQGADCVCSCGGRYHGGLQAFGWTPVGDTTLVRPGIVRQRFIYGGAR